MPGSRRADGVVQVDRKLLNTPSGSAALVDELTALRGMVRIGLDVIGGIAGLAEAMLTDAGFALVHIAPGVAANRARQGTVGGEKLPASRRGGVVQAQTRRLSRLRDLLIGIFPGLAACLGLTASAGKKRLVRHRQAVGGLPKLEDLADRVLAVAAEQTIAVPAERMTARLVRELALEALASRTCLIELGRELEALLQRHHRFLAIRLRSSRWRSHRREAALIRSLPGMGAVPANVPAKSRSDWRGTAELIAEAGNLARFRFADVPASAAGMAPVLRQSGRTRFLRRPNGGNKGLKRVVCQSAFCSRAHEDSRAFYQHKRREGKQHHQAVIALARRRMNVLWAVIQSRTPFQTGSKTAARLNH